MSALDKKLLRDLASLRGQVITIALVVACGIASYIAMRTAYDSLITSRDEYYEKYRFADVFANLKRAPGSLSERIENIPGVVEVQTRVVERVLVPLDKLPRPVSGTIVSVDRHATSQLNGLFLKEGRELDPRHPDEVILIDGFATAHDLRPGSSLPVVINGTLRKLRVVGVALSPEFVMTLAPGQLTYDPGLAPVLWMNHAALEAAFRLEGAFNSVTLRLERDASRAAVLTELDMVLKPYGGIGSVARDKQQSNYMLSGELAQLDSMAGFVPYLFLGVAALLVNVVLSRLVQLQRSSIATLKAIGYDDRAITLHYLKLVSVIVIGGAALGIGVGSYLGRLEMHLYTDQFFRFAEPRYVLAPSAVIFSVAISVASACFGAWFAVRRVATMPPAEAMRPAAPARYRRSLLEVLGVWRFLTPVMRMIWRELSRRPLRLMLSALGIALGVGINVVARSMTDSMDYLIDVQFHRSMREDLNVTFMNPVPRSALSSLRSIPGVHYAESLRSVPVRFRSAHQYRDAVIQGYSDQQALRKLIDDHAIEVSVPEHGMLLTEKLAEILGVRPGERITVEIREGDFRETSVTVAGLVREPFGLSGHMTERSVARLLGDTAPISTALLTVEPNAVESIELRLKTFPTVASVASPQDFKRQFNEQSAAIMNVFMFIMSLFATIIAVGVIYNNARVALSQRDRDLASLRVLGFTKREVAAILFGEQAIQIAISIPLGLYVGRALTIAMMTNADPETYRLPVSISAQTYVFAIGVTLIAAVLSALLLRRKLDQLDLIGVLKTRE